MAAADASRMALSADDVSPAPGHTTPSWATAEVPSSPPGLSFSSADAGSIWGAVSGGGWLAGGARATSIGGSSAGSALIPSRGSGLVKASPEEGASPFLAAGAELAISSSPPRARDCWNRQIKGGKQRTFILLQYRPNESVRWVVG